MQVKQIYQILDEISPFELQEKWDNSGLNLGSLDSSFEKIYLTLEADLLLAKNIEPRSLIIAHHPLIFSPLKTLNYQTYPSNIASILLAKHCSLIAMHTNFDYTHLNTYFASKALGISHWEKQDFALFSPLPLQSFETLIQTLKTNLNAHTLKALKASEQLSSIFVVCGSGMSALPLIPSNSQACLITGDIKHHDATWAQSLGISLIDVGHYESEIFFSQLLCKILQNYGYEAIIKNLENPLKFY